ncbi:UDP-N-acetylmuramoyl-tripeptide--D-alanyl-D-alanine ligase [Reichenbachiella carrageenanivorans]|uniref:UDP-N-acetylmuramoyl-tripeptide--D-alanyl-D-alanine ligase n=1 Tax=Reichenbachiella carrageenanivorans TaxID=2979869 RepID=A0ABY6D2R6_9BACT|nr:UDP-N-acetylmuramoyl-tripeptide--D-alanyl-D-alanine ligase [Reichenbachiella carrageenanivorans]UXX80455.1 UDP-N-acetylmuramoyl-tripeptide--D-alanyl-D-alanine ligase [Reichenbachiella carrageenanivorans]
MDQTISFLYEKFLLSDGICTDTRALQKNQLFFALKGEHFNGNAYAEQAIASGALLAIIDEPQSSINNQFLLVDDVLTCLQQLASHHRSQFNIPFLAITGSNGKTSTKELTARVMASDRKVQYTKGNLNNHIGVPLTLLTIESDTEFVIVEMGANHLGEIATLCEIAKPTHGLITNIGSAHIGEFGGKEAIIRAKSELFDYLRKTGGVPFINLQDPVLQNMSKRFANAITYPNEWCALKSATPFVYYKDEYGDTHSTEMIGAYNFWNICAAVTIGKYFKVEDPYPAIDGYMPDNNRSQMIELGSNTIILDAYNANPDSVLAALNNLAVIKSQNRIAIIGDMKELGTYSLDEHKKVIDFAETLGLDAVYWVGNDFVNAYNHSKSKAFVKIEDLISLLQKQPLAGATVLIKGSRGMRMEQLTEHTELWT